MYAVFRTGGKQYRASQGERVRVERLDAAVGDAVEFDQVLMVGEGASIKVGAPLVVGPAPRAAALLDFATALRLSENDAAASLLPDNGASSC